ncbi:MAG TPA: hypothetical protein VIE65_14770, partial [Methylobacter sp.]
ILHRFFSGIIAVLSGQNHRILAVFCRPFDQKPVVESLRTSAGLAASIWKNACASFPRNPSAVHDQMRRRKTDNHLFL